VLYCFIIAACQENIMAVKAKRRTKIISAAPPSRNGNGFHKKHSWMPGDPPETHPLFSLMGKYKDDPEFEASVQLMKKLRQEELERDLKWLEDSE
jgi:hypothetical protein